MKRILVSTLIILFITSCSVDNEDIVREHLKECNNYNYINASYLLGTGYEETFIDGSIEIKDLIQFKEFIEWGEVMKSKTNIISIESIGDTVKTTVETSNLMDEILERKPRNFKIAYILNEKKILKSIIDTIPGYAQTLEFNNKKLNYYINYCLHNGLQDGIMEMNQEAAITLRESLMIYKNSH
jgi:hypothetical protein